jgi:hypothetical protein
MKNTILFVLVLIGLNLSGLVSKVEAKEQFIGPNFSGIYSCKGSNNKVGEYEVVATLKLNRISSRGGFGVYDFNTETENSLVYKGHAIANGYKLALTFNLSDGRTAEYSTGIADIQKIVAMGLMQSPVLAINNKPVLVGFISDIEKIKKLIQENK